MFYDTDDRARRLAEYLIAEKSTVRSTAAAFGISKSTVHKDVSCRLKRLDPALYAEAAKILDTNKSERHIRGGNATKRKYESAKETKYSK
ncbi:MAG: sporulation transcriptional regulator SpoIIID [Clostridia bacterium]|nr:sporulation transcriptional regulator SpoIIID [Clostridia bacterium]